MAATCVDATLHAYERWAPVYPPFAHNPLMRVEERAMLERWPEVADRWALDLACGTGRYTRQLARSGARTVVAIDFCVPMLQRVATTHRVCANMSRLPFAGCAFDVVVSGLALGHAPALQPWMSEAARVLAPGGTLLYSDFHPEAAHAGLTRSFKDQNDQTCTVPHHCHEVAAQRDAAAQAGLRIESLHEIRVGEELCEPFANCEDFYRRWHGLPIVLVIRACKPFAQIA